MDNPVLCQTYFIGAPALHHLDLSGNRKLCILNSVNNPDLKVVWLWSGIKMDSLEVDEHTEVRYK